MADDWVAVDDWTPVGGGTKYPDMTPGVKPEGSTHPVTGKAPTTILGAAKEGYASAPSLVPPESGVGKWLREHGMEGLTMPFAPAGAILGLQSGLEQGAVEAGEGAKSPLLGRDVAGMIESAGQTGAPHIPVFRGITKADQPQPGAMTLPQAGEIATKAQAIAAPDAGILRKIAGSEVRPEIREAHDAGYRFPPAEIPPVGERPSLASSIAAGEAGKIKLWQQSSTGNQVTTNNLGAEAIGLPKGTHLDERSFATAAEPAAAVYEEVKKSIPEVELGRDMVYQKEAAGIGGHGSLLEENFPELAASPKILEIREMMTRQGNVSTTQAMETIAALRKEAKGNFKKPADPEAHALGLAQRQASDVMESALQRAVENAPRYFRRKVDEAIARRGEATSDFNYLNESRGYMPASEFAAKVRVALDRVMATNGQVKTWQGMLDNAMSKDSSLQTLPNRLKDARKLFAKIYTLDDATNSTTGNVSAAGLAKVYNRGAPLTDELETIARAYNAAPKSMQVPELFGRSEEWSALDFYGTALAAMHGNVPVAAAIAMRSPVRRALLSGPYQRAIIGPSPGGIPPLPPEFMPSTARSAADDLGLPQ